MQNMACSEQHHTAERRAVMLAGLTPDIIMDVAARGMAFYDFQMHLELVGCRLGDVK